MINRCGVARAAAHMVGTLLLVLWGMAAQGAVSAWLDRDTVGEGETVRLTVEVSGGGSLAEPDLTPLSGDFQVLGTSRSMRRSMVNGRFSSRASLTYTLLPLRSGDLVVPALRVGSERTPALKVTVVPGRGRAPGAVAPFSSPGLGGDPEVFMEAEAQPADPYVQSQVTYTLRIYSSLPLVEMAVDLPAGTEAVVERLGEDLRLTDTREGRAYQVIERRYALFPHRPGVLRVQGVRLTGQVSDPASAFASPFGGLGMMDPFGRGLRSVQAEAPAVSVRVRPRPAGSGGGDWLPARAMALDEAWEPSTPVFRVGEPLIRTVTVSGRGLPGTLLPVLPQTPIPGLKAYADPSTTQSHSEGVHLLGRRAQRVTYVPEREGTVTLPALEVRWWDVVADQARVARLPSRSFQVLAADGSPAVRPAGEGGSPWGFWTWVAGVLLAVWGLTLGLWFGERRRRSNLPTGVLGPVGASPANLRAARREVEEACLRGTPDRARDALLDWGRVAWSDSAPATVAELAERLRDPAARRAVLDLDRTLYAGPHADWDGTACWEALAQTLGASRPEQGAG